jgi:hypothetical protein
VAVGQGNIYLWGYPRKIDTYYPDSIKGSLLKMIVLKITRKKSMLKKEKSCLKLQKALLDIQRKIKMK